MAVGLAREISRQLRRQRYPWPVRLIHSVTVLLLSAALCLLSLELAVRLLGLAPALVVPEHQRLFFSQVAHVLNDEFQTNAFVADDWLLWRFEPGANFTGVRVDKMGCLGPYGSPSPGSTNQTAILILGDELACVGARTFPSCLSRLLRDAELRRPFVVINASVPYFSTTQFLRWKDQLSELRPTAVIVCSGGADGAPSLGLPDDYLGFRKISRAILSFAEWSHVARLVVYGFRDKQEKAIASAKRVPLSRYEDNLKALIAWSRSQGAYPVLLTRPTSPRAPSQTNSYGATEGLVGESPVRPMSYNDVMRQVALQTHAELVDVEQEFVRRSAAIHFDEAGKGLSPVGHNLVARLLLASLKRVGVITQSEFEQAMKRARYDTAVPDHPQVAWLIRPASVEITTLTQVLRFDVIMANTGNTTWLSSRSGSDMKRKVGGTALYARWEAVESSTTSSSCWTPAIQWELPLDVQPGEATSTTVELSSPSVPGNYALWFGLHAQAVGCLARYGAAETSVSVICREQFP